MQHYVQYGCRLLITSPNQPTPAIPRNNHCHGGGVFLSKSITSTDLGDKLESSYINNVDLMKLERRAISTLEDSKSRVHSSLVQNAQLCIHIQCICLSLASPRSRPRVKDSRSSHLSGRASQVAGREIRKGRTLRRGTY